MKNFFKICCAKFDQVFGDVKNPSWQIEKVVITERENPQLLISLLTVYEYKSKHNSWYQQPILLEAAEIIIHSLAQKKSMGGLRRWLPVLSESYPLVVKHLPKLKKPYESFVFDLASYLAHAFIAKKDLTQFTSANVGYGTNHLAVELKGLSQYLKYCAKDIGDIKGIDKKFLKNYLKKFMDYMHPTGYWAECDGPALAYNTLTAVSLMCAAHELGEFKTYKEHFMAVSVFHSLATMPDGQFVDIMDGRNANCTYSNRGCFLPLTSAGMALYSTMVKILSQQMPDEKYFGEPLNHLLFDEKMRELYGVSKEKSIWAKKNSHFDLGDFLLCKNQNWISAVSCFKGRPRPEGHFNIDYQNLLFLYHTEFGEIFGGQNSKNDPEISTFSKFMNTFDGAPVEKPMPKYIPGNGYFEYKKNNVYLTRDYRGFEGCISIDFKSANKIEISFQARARANEYPINCNLILPCSINQPFLDSNKKPVVLTESEKTFNNAKVGKHIYFTERKGAHLIPKTKNHLLKMSLPEEAEIIWPFKAWDTYNLKSDRAIHPGEWYCVMVIKVTNEPVKLQIEVK